MNEPSSQRVTGMSAIISTMNGTERPRLTTKPSTALIARPSQRCPKGASRKRPCSVPTRMMPSGRPTTNVMAMAMAVM